MYNPAGIVGLVGTEASVVLIGGKYRIEIFYPSHNQWFNKSRRFFCPQTPKNEGFIPVQSEVKIWFVVTL
jgi:hypothetical protein